MASPSRRHAEEAGSPAGFCRRLTTQLCLGGGRSSEKTCLLEASSGRARRGSFPGHDARAGDFITLSSPTSEAGRSGLALGHSTAVRAVRIR